MKRLHFVKTFFTGTSALLATPVVAIEPEIKKYSFDELFCVPFPNPILIYPRKESKIYQILEEFISDRLDINAGYTYYPARDLILPIKEFYTEDDFEPVKLYLQRLKHGRTRFSYAGSKEECKVFYQFIKIKTGGMHFEAFVNHRY